MDRLAADSPLWVPPYTMGGATRTETLRGACCEGAGPARRWRDQQRACKFRNLCDSTQRIESIDEYGIRQYIKKWGRLGVSPHQKVLTALEQRAAWYQNSQTYKELEDKQLLDEVIDETGTILCASEGGEERS
jgi:hypothetical protein